MMLTFAHADCSKASAAWITLDLISPLTGGVEPYEWVEINRAGCVTTRYAHYDRRAGIYQHSADAPVLARIDQLASDKRIARFDARAVRAEIRGEEQAKAKALGTADFSFIVSDADRVRVEIRNDGNASTLIEFEAAAETARAFPQVSSLQALVALIDELRAVGNAAGKRKIAEVTP